MSVSSYTSVAANLNENDSSTDGNLSIPAPNYHRTLPCMLLFFLAAVLNVVGCVFMIRSKKNNDAISTALVGLAVSGVLFSVNGFATVSVFLYISFNSPDGVPFMLCSITLYCWFLSILITTEQMFIISVIRVVSILKIHRMSVAAGGFTRKKAILVTVVVWTLSTLCCMVTMGVDYAESSSRAPFCRFRSSVGLFKITTIYIIIVHMFSYTTCVLIYGVSIGILVKVHHRRRQVDKKEDPKGILPASEINSDISTICDTELNKVVIQDSRLSRVKIAWDSINAKASRCQIRFKQRFEQISRSQNGDNVMDSVASISNPGQPHRSRTVYRNNPGKRPSVLVATAIIGVLIVLHSVSSIPWIVQMVRVTRNTESLDSLFQAMLFAVVTFLVNPFIYIMSLPQVREKVLRCVKCCKN